VTIRSGRLPAALVAVLLSAGCATGSRGFAPTADAGQTMRFVDYADNDGTTLTVILTGAVGDAGTAQSIRADGSVDPDHRGNSTWSWLAAHSGSTSRIWTRRSSPRLASSRWIPGPARAASR
jgi:hypothetical protein